VGNSSVVSFPLHVRVIFISAESFSAFIGDIASSGDNSSNREQVKLNNASVNADQFDHQLISENINAEKDSAEMKITRTCNGNETTEELPTECVVCQNNAVTISFTCSLLLELSPLEAISPACEESFGVDTKSG
jgi:hypothetical protein